MLGRMHFLSLPNLLEASYDQPSLATKVSPLCIQKTAIIKQSNYPAASGSLGDVYKCTWNRDAGPDEVAVKSPRFPDVRSDLMATVNKSIDREVHIWAILEHAYILPFYGTVAGFGPFRGLVSPWMPNGNLNTYLGRTGVTLTTIDRLCILKQITEGLKYLHDNNVIHGNLNIYKVLIAADGSPRLAGFGISNIVMQAKPTYSFHPGAVRWVAPELMIVPEDNIRLGTKSSDTYALGCIMLQVLYGKQPYWWIKNAVHVISAKFEFMEPINSSILVQPNHLDFMRRCWLAESEARPLVVDVLKFLQLQHEASLVSRPRQQPHDAESDSQPPIFPEVMLQDLTKCITRIGEFPVARGGFGDIWKCNYKTDLGPTKVAVKSLLVYAADEDGKAMKTKFRRIQHELKICAGVTHSNIIPVLGYTSGFGPFMAIVTPWAENGNLTAYLEREDASVPVVRRFHMLRDIVAGLQHLHTHNIIHGDLTGLNVLIHGDGSACLTDFGLSLVYSEVVGITQASWTSTFHGNFRWLAPELLGEPEDDLPVRPRKCSDIYSFGNIMLNVLTSKVPYYYLREAAATRCLYAGKKPDRSRYPAFSNHYWHFIEECWSDAPGDRPSAERVVEVIKDELDSLSSSSAA